ncbi:MAG: hypothetical protein JW838_03150 [Spirochaetes bacterium]|nr:hypothetical protein [Spirochaetota bacterium]
MKAGAGKNFLDPPPAGMVAKGMRATTSMTGPAARFCTLALAVPLFLPFVQGCAGVSKKPSYRHHSVRSIPVGTTVRGEDIDGYAAHVVYFRLEKPVAAMTVGISAEYVADITGKKKYKKAYFIVEKIINLPAAGANKARRIYMEIGKNFDTDWNREKEITIKSLKTEPFRTLDADSLYRIRYTAFSRDPFDYAITIDADSPVTFSDSAK